jgi:hypothetical protein
MFLKRSGILQRFGLIMMRTPIYRYMILRNEAFSKRLPLFRILVMSGADQKLSFNETRIMNVLDQLKVVTSLKFFCLLLFEGTFTSFFKVKIIKKSQNSRNQGFSYYLLLDPDLDP